MSTPRGYIYILINTSYPGLLKIGKSKRSPEIRANELSLATGVPNSFYVAYYLIVSDIDKAETNIHQHLKEYRESRNREFFRLPLNQAIDLLRKVLKKSNIDFANHEEETYKFRFEEYTSPKDFFTDILKDEDKWEHAKLHLEKGYLIPWLKKKGEIDALINLDLRSKEKEFENFDYRLSLIAYSIIDSPFIFQSQEVYTLSSLFVFLNSEIFSESSQLEIWKNCEFLKRYKGFLDVDNEEEDEIYNVIYFIYYYFNDFPEPKLQFIKKVIDWHIEPENFFPIERLNRENFRYLINIDDFFNRIMKPGLASQEISMLLIPETSPKNVRKCLDLIFEFEDLLNTYGFKISELNDFKEHLIVNEYIPNEFYFTYFTFCKLSISNYILKNLKTKSELDEISKKYTLPKGLYESVTQGDSITKFILATATLNLLLNDWIDVIRNHESYSYPFQYILKRIPDFKIFPLSNKEDKKNTSSQLHEEYEWLFMEIPKKIWETSYEKGISILDAFEENRQKI
jgi:hypothetical protein